MKNFKYIVCFSSAVAISQLVAIADQNDKTASNFEEIIPSLASSDVKTRCHAQAIFDEMMEDLSTAELRSVLLQIFNNTDPETTRRLESSLEEAFIERNYVKELGYLGITIKTAILFREGKQVKVVMAANVTAGSPAAKAGIEDGDLITAIDGNAMEGPNCEPILRRAIASKGAGASCKFTIHRDGEFFDKDVTLASREKDLPPQAINDLRKPTRAQKHRRFLKWLETQKLAYEEVNGEAERFQPGLDAQVEQMIRIDSPFRR